MPYKDPLIAKAAKRAYYLAHKEQFYQSGKRRRLMLQAAAKATKEAEALVPKPLTQRVCVDCGVDITTIYIPKHGPHCKACVAAYNKAYRNAHAVEISMQKAQWKLANKERVAKNDKAYAQKNPDKRTLARKKWVLENPGKDTAAKALNTQKRKKRTPAWLTADNHWMLEQAYELAALRTKMFGFPWHVDHVIPLNGKNVSGLHTPYNLQVIPGVENLRKGNKMVIA